MYADPAAFDAASANAAAMDRECRAPLSRRFIAEQLFVFGRQVRGHLQSYPAVFAGREDAVGVELRRRALDTCCRLAREFEWLAFQAFANDAVDGVNREQLEAVVMDLRERVAALHEVETAA